MNRLILAILALISFSVFSDQLVISDYQESRDSWF